MKLLAQKLFENRFVAIEASLLLSDVDLKLLNLYYSLAEAPAGVLLMSDETASVPGGYPVLILIAIALLVFLFIITRREHRPYHVEPEPEFKTGFDKFEQIVENHSDLVAVIDSNNCFLYVNEAYCDLFGKSPRQLIGTSFSLDETGTGTPATADILQELALPPHQVEFNQRAMTQKGWRWISWVFKSVSDAGNGTALIVGTGTDITERKMEQEALKASEESYRGLFNSVNEAIYIQTKDGTFLDVNDHACKMYGYSRLELIGRSPEILSAPGKNDLDSLRTIIEKAYKGEVQHLEWWGKRKNGEIFPKSITLNSGSYFGKAVVIAVARDVSDQKQYEESIRLSEYRLRTLADNIPNGDVYLFDRNLKFLIAAGTELKRLGFSSKQFEGKKLEDVLDAETTQALLPMYRTALLGEKVNSEYTFRDSIYQITVLPLYNKDGNIEFGMSLVQNVTRQKNYEQALRNSEERFQAFMQYLPGVAFMKDSQGRYMFANELLTRLFHKHKTDWLGKTDFQLYGSNTARQIVMNDRKVIDSGKGIHIIETIGEGEHATQWITAKFPIPDKHGNRVLVGGIAVDITDRIKVEQKLKISLKEKEVLLKEVYHRVKNNLQITSSLLELQSAHVRDEYDRELFRESQNRLSTMAMIHEQLYKTDNLSSINMQDYITSLVNGLLQSYDAGDVTTDIRVDDTMFTLDTAIPLGLIINEIVTNSLKYAFRKQVQRENRLTIRLNKRAENVMRLIVADNGPGLPSQDVIDSKKSLGMELIEALTSQLGGKLDIKSDGGAVFAITFPGSKA
ncbi:MAG: PAS domain S-box protein [Balneolaceae bacterium]|nr:MAG: PAS domain S-box protein [Balneolaceae bacterium]